MTLVYGLASLSNLYLHTQDEKKIRLQASLFLCCNEFPRVQPEDAYHTLRSINFNTKFMSQKDIEERGTDCPEHWKLADANIKKWLKQDKFIDAFTWLILDAYGDGAMLDPPKSVIDFTSEFTEGANRPEIDKIADIIKYDPNPKSVVLVDEIKHALKQIKIDISSQRIKKHIETLYNKKATPPNYKRIRKSVCSEMTDGLGWTNLRIEKTTVYNEREVDRADRIIRSELIRGSLNSNGKRDATAASDST